MKVLYLISVTVIIWSCQPKSRQFDLIIRNAMIYDGSGNTPYAGDLAVSGDTIAAMGDLSRDLGNVEFDAKDLSVAPGFINMLSWANETLIEDGRSQSDLRQGVTLEVLGEGSSMGPWSDQMIEEEESAQGNIRYDVEWQTLGGYMEYMESRGVATNLASFVGNATLRRYVMGYDQRTATSEEMEEMTNLLDREMAMGAMGISSSLLYAPSRYANTAELIALSKIAAKHGGMYISHIRDEGEYLLESIKELIVIAKEADIAAEIYHLKASGKAYWPKLDTAFDLIESARAEGLKITADIYTYPASSTGLHVQLPEWVREGGIPKTIERLTDKSLRKKILKDIKFEYGPDKILFVGFKNPDLRVYIGKRLDEVAEILNKTPAEAMVDLIVEDDSRIQVVYFSMSEENIAKKMAKPWVSFCSDAGSFTNEGVFLKQSTHPRAYGSFIRVLGKYARDEKVITLAEGIRRLTSFPAANLKIQKRGALQVGNFADVVVFDPAEVHDQATFEDPHQYALGVRQVWVNGIQVIENGEPTGAKPGRFVRGPGWQPEAND